MSSCNPSQEETSTIETEHNLSGTTGDKQHNENQANAAMLLQVSNKNYAEEDLNPRKRGQKNWIRISIPVLLVLLMRRRLSL